ncbi:MAG TPA: ABC transporter substrate-binding protein [Euzebyales bacterium]|nr:ABC transporter substrate-binding protein [Euzebyales bacterium]
MYKRRLLLTLVLVLSLVLAACGGASETQDSSEGSEPAAEGAAPSAPAVDDSQYERSETLYTSGTMWGPPANWNPFMSWARATGTFGLLYESLFRYDPMTNEYIPWLAESGDWTSETVYELTVRDGITWSDGEPLTAEDVKFTFDLGQQYDALFFAPLWEFLEGVEVADSTVTFTFSESLYQEWANYLYGVPIVPQHIWSELSEEDITAGPNENPVGSGAYTYDTHSEDRMVWLRNPNWWGTEAVGMEMKPKRIVDIVNSDNNTALGLVLQGQLDLSNNFLPGIAALTSGGSYSVKTYYSEPPYMLAANTAWLVTNNTKAPMDDPEFRKALAWSINVDQIVERVYDNIVAKASPTGMLPYWEDYVDQGVVDELGFSYDPDRARQILADAGYTDTNGDGMVETPEGEQIALTVAVPNGWTDWMESVRVIAQSAQEVGINLETDFPDFDSLVDGRNSGDFDMVINNEKQVSNTPWTYYDYMFRMPIQENQTAGNFGRYENQEAWDLVTELNKQPVDDQEGMQQVLSQLQRIHLEDMPIIPLWYNGMWAQYNEAVWTNWPSADTDNNALPTTWQGYWEMTAIDMLANLEPAPAEGE